MKNIVKKFLSAVIILVIFIPGLHARELSINSKMQFDYALKLFNEKDYETAVVELKRFMHFFPDDSQVLHARYKLGLSLYGLKKYHDAAKVFNNLIIEKQDHQYKTESYFLQSQAFGQMGNFGYARIVLHNYLKVTSDPAVQDRIYSRLADLEIQASKGIENKALEQAKNSLEKISAAGQDRYLARERIDVINQALDAPDKSPALAGMFAIVPGGGFLYCERYRDALVSFLLNAGLIYASYEAFEEGHEALGGILAFVEAGFYTGNIYGSISAAHRHNEQMKIKILNRQFKLVSGVDLKKQALLLGLKYDF